MPFRVSNANWVAEVVYDDLFDRFNFTVKHAQTQEEFQSSLDNPDIEPSLTEIANQLEQYDLSLPRKYRKLLVEQRKEARKNGSAGQLKRKS